MSLDSDLLAGYIFRVEKLSSFWSCPIKGSPVKIGFSDVSDRRVVEAVAQIQKEGWANPVLIPSPSHDDKKRYLEALAGHCKKKDDHALAHDKLIEDSLYVGIAMLLEGEIKGLLAGSLRPTPEVVRAAFHFIGARNHHTLVSGQFFMESESQMMSHEGPLLLADCAVMPEPSSRALASIAVDAAQSFEYFTQQKAKVAFLSFSTRGSAEHPLIDRIREALVLTKKINPLLDVDGEIQVDAALSLDVAKIKGAGDSALAGKANVLIFPTLEAGNLGYKIAQRFSSARVAGPILWGLNRPMSDLSRGCSVREIIDTARLVCRMVGGQN